MHLQFHWHFEAAIPLSLNVTTAMVILIEITDLFYFNFFRFEMIKYYLEKFVTMKPSLILHPLLILSGSGLK